VEADRALAVTAPVEGGGRKVALVEGACSGGARPLWKGAGVDREGLAPSGKRFDGRSPRYARPTQGESANINMLPRACQRAKGRHPLMKPTSVTVKRDEVLRRMLKTPPTPHKSLGKRSGTKPKTRGKDQFDGK
jgi:hypothetical protein